MAAVDAQRDEQGFFLERFGQGIHSRLRTGPAGTRSICGNEGHQRKSKRGFGLALKTGAHYCRLPAGFVGSVDPSRNKSTSISSPGLSFTSRPFCSRRKVVLAASPYQRALPAVVASASSERSSASFATSAVPPNWIASRF